MLVNMGTANNLSSIQFRVAIEGSRIIRMYTSLMNAYLEFSPTLRYLQCMAHQVSKPSLDTSIPRIYSCDQNIVVPEASSQVLD